ncbi:MULTISPECIES: type VI secretion system-associated FHA domain protein TagH [unclassified Mesorhizobium]|uniref:type VI secretion system-associated FHA domain protein TagH n=1 Tax=unclassified Mesorhizobium TaxID=325217 RepID=UPI00301547D5
MSLVLTLEQGPRPQAMRQASLQDGELVIGRSTEADWRIDDPDMFVSRAHCTIASGPDGYTVTDTSSSGLFVDDAHGPLGSGNSTALRHGMRLRLGDYVLRVDLQDATAPQPSTFAPPAAVSRAPVAIDRDDFFSARVEEEPRRQRPADLPNPFEHPEPGAYQASERSEVRLRSSPAFNDPFSMDPVATPKPEEEKGDGFDGNSPFFGGPVSGTRLETPSTPAERQPVPRPAPAQKPAGAPSDGALRDAFLRGMGLNAAALPTNDAIAEMEEFGREYRLMMDGLMQLLRKRAEEKGNARIAQTVVQASGVNPLKFLPTVEDALETLIAESSPGFLPADAAIKDAVRDLAHHHVSAWRGIQGALRHMIDRFDPATIEAELKSHSKADVLLAGGRRAKLWDLYLQRHREIATNAETRFMGEIGADFRNAYEQE